MKKTFLLAIFALFALSSIFCEDTLTMPDPVGFTLLFTKKGESKFGVFADSECLDELTAIDFPIQESVTSVATMDFYVNWDLYDTYSSGVKVELRFANNIATYEKDVADDSNTGYCLSFDNSGTDVMGLNYSVSSSDVSDISSASDSVLEITGDDIKTAIPASKRLYSFDIKESGTASVDYLSGKRKVTLTINPPTYGSGTTAETAFMAVEYTGIIAILLKVE